MRTSVISENAGWTPWTGRTPSFCFLREKKNFPVDLEIFLHHTTQNGGGVEERQAPS